MRKRRISIPVLVLIVIAILGLLAGILLRNAGVPKIYCCIFVIIAAIYVAIADKYNGIEQHGAEVVKKAIMDKKMSKKEFAIYLTALKLGELSSKEISIIQSALELDNPELLKKARDIINNPKLLKDAKELIKESELSESVKEIFNED